MIGRIIFQSVHFVYSIYKFFKNNSYKICIIKNSFSLIYFHFLSSQSDAMSVATEISESSTSDLHSLEVGIRALCEVNNAETSCTEERTVDLKTKSL